MPVHKYRRAEDMPDRTWMSPDDPELWPAIVRLWETTSRLAPLEFPPGVYKHRSIGDMNRQTDAWREANIRRINGLDEA